MSNKTLEQKIHEMLVDEDINCGCCGSMDYNNAAEKLTTLFKQNLHLLSPSDVAKIPSVAEVLIILQYTKNNFSMMPKEAQRIIDAISNFEPKKKEAE